jgi:pimeloyl-ACP methyl ester carboxylesterase
MGKRLEAQSGQDVMIDGERVHYFEQGAGDAIVLIHGFPSSGALSFGQLFRLLPTDRRTVAVDLAGLGWSDRDRRGSYDLRSQALRVLKAMDALGITQATVVGTSLGGAVAQHLGLLAPERVERLVLLASLDASEPAGRGAWKLACVVSVLLAAARLPWLGPRVRLKIAKPESGWDAAWTQEAALEATRFTQLRGTVRSSVKVVRDSARAPRPDITAISVPTLIVSGGDDTSVPVSVGEGIAAKIKGSRHVVLPGCRHGLATHQPQAVADLIRGELAG